MSAPDLDNMTKDELLAWFKSDPDLTPVFDKMVPSTEPVAAGPVPMELSSIRLPVDLVRQLDAYAEARATKRSVVIRDVLVAFLAANIGPESRDDVVHALDVLRRAVTERYPEAA